MARKPSKKKAGAKKIAGTKKAGAKKTGASATDLSRHIIDTAFELARERGWRDLSLAEIAEAAGVSLSRLHPIFPSKQALLEGFADRVDAAMLGEGSEPLETPARDPMFDMRLRRSDVLQPSRGALALIRQHPRLAPPA